MTMPSSDPPITSKGDSSSHPHDKEPSRIAFGSCNNQDRENRLWSVIEGRDPTAFIFGGDAIYADIEHGVDLFSWPPSIKPQVQCATPDRVRELYKRQKEVPDYARIVNDRNITIFGTIDDHDFGCDNADRTFEHKYETTNAFVDFIDEPSTSPMAIRAATGKGVYGVKLFDFERRKDDRAVPESEACIDPDYLSSSTASTCRPSYSDRSVAVFVLDVRTNKDPWREGIHAYSTDYEGDYLGEEQWQWFEAAISNSNAAVNVIVNGLQVHSEIFPNPNIAESWSSFPYSQRRLWNAVLAPNVQAPFLISGDVHMTQLHRKDCRPVGSTVDAFKRPLMELTTSGMTHSWGRISTPFVEKSDNGIYQSLASIVDEQIRSLVARITMHTLHQFLPWKSLMTSHDNSGKESNDEQGMNGGMERAKTGLQYSLERNFGELEFDWDERTVTIRSIGEDPSASPLLAARVSMDMLSGISPIRSSDASSHLDVNQTHTGLTQTNFAGVSSLQSNYADDWVCVDYRGTSSTLDQVSGYASAVIVLLTIFVAIPFLLPCFIYHRRRRAVSFHVTASSKCSNLSSVTNTSSSGQTITIDMNKRTNDLVVNVNNSNDVPSMSSSVVSMEDYTVPSLD